MPSVDLLEMFLRLADKHGLKFYFGLYDSGKYWDTGDLSWEIEDNKYVIDEVWKNYGSKFKSFQGWYISGEISRKTKGAIGAFQAMGKHVFVCDLRCHLSLLAELCLDVKHKKPPVADSRATPSTYLLTGGVDLWTAALVFFVK